MSPQIRTAQLQDFAQIMRLYRELQPQDPVLTNGNDERAFATIVASPGLDLFVYDTGQELAASLYLNIIPNISRSAAPYAIIENVVTLSQWRRQGLGQRLMQHGLAVAWNQGGYKVMLQTGSTQDSTHRFYKRCGFTSDEKTGYLARPPNSTHD